MGNTLLADNEHSSNELIGKTIAQANMFISNNIVMHTYSYGHDLYVNQVYGLSISNKPINKVKDYRYEEDNGKIKLKINIDEHGFINKIM